MAIGDIKASGGLQTQLVSDRSSEITSQAVSGLGDAVNRLAAAGFSYLNSKTDIEAIYDHRAQASMGLELDTRLLKYQADRAAEFAEYSRERSANPSGMTKDYDASLGKHEAEFLKTVPPRFQEEVKAKLAQDRAQRVASAFSSELTLLDTVDTNNLNTNLNALGTAIKGGKATLADAQVSWEEMVGKTALPAEQKLQFIESGRATLQGLQFGTQVELAAKGFGSVRDGSDGSDVVAAGLLPQDRGVLNAIAKNEAGSYDVWNGGTKFQGYKDHPAALGKAPGESTAAGRYQFLLGTWRDATASYEKKYGMKVPDFSPEWQDRVALHWAEEKFNQHYSGATFREILASGDPAKMLIIRDVLGKPRSSSSNDLEWKGLGHMKDAEFIEMLTGKTGIAGGGTGAAAAPNPWTDPQFSDISLEGKLSLANAAAAAAEANRKDIATAIKLERADYLDQVYNAGYAGTPGVLEALQASRGWDAEAQARYNAGQEVFRASEKSVGLVGKALAEGSPLSQAEIKSYGKWFGEDSFAGIANGDVEAYKKMKWAVGQSRLFPDGSADAFAAAMGNPSTAPVALAFLASALAGDSSILKRSGFDNDTIAEVRMYKNMAGREATPEAAYESFSRAKDAADRTGKSPAQINTEASKLFLDNYPTIDSVIDKWDGYFNRRPDTKLNPSVEGQLMLDASTAFRDGYSMTGSVDGADAYMQTALDNLYGVSQTQSAPAYWGPGDFGPNNNGTVPVLMRLPPEKYYPAKDFDYGYLYNSIADMAESAGARRDGAVLIPDAQTEKEVRDGKAPTYKVLGVGELGEAIVLPGRFGGEALMKQATDSIVSDAATTNSLNFVNEYAAQEAQLSNLTESEKAFDKWQLAFGGGPNPNSQTPALEERLADVTQKLKAAVISALEQGHLNPELAKDNVIIQDVAKKMSGELATRLQSDAALSRRFSQALAENRNVEPGKILAGLIAKELKVPAALAEMIALELNGGN